MQNQAIRDEIKNTHLFQWQVASAIGISEMTLIRWLRTNLSSEQEIKIKTAINALKENN